MLSSAEVGTLITALGCGIGNSEFNPDKLRYHSIVIMTDADVDGSHIRTLLLTFFFRQMPELIERGHIYIAQPPLYKISKGKQEQYLKDDDALTGFLTNAAVENSVLHVAPDAPALPGEQLEKLVYDHRAVYTRIEQLARVYPKVVLEALLKLPKLEVEHFESESDVQTWVEQLNSLLTLENENSKTHSYQASVFHQVDKHHYLPSVAVTAHGVEYTVTLSYEFFLSDDYSKLQAFGSEVESLFEEGAFVAKGERKFPVADFNEAIERIMAESKRGYGIQRYKGLGEMNPEQLWETTMDPDNRRMLQVTIEDAIAADQIFTCLMGDHVEPRREFIESNALAVANLDI